MKQKANGFTLIETLIVIAVIALVVILGWSLYSHTRSSSVESEMTMQSSEDSKKDSSSHSKTYRKDGLSLEYPNDWILSERMPYTEAELGTVTISKNVSYDTATSTDENKAKYKNDLALHITKLSPDYYNGFAKDNQFTPDDGRKHLGEVDVNGKKLVLIGHATGESISSLTIAECKIATDCNLYINFDNEKYALINIGSLVQSRLHPIEIDTSSEDYKTLLGIASSLEL